MQGQKVFTVEEAQELIPTLSRLLSDANDDLTERLEFVRAANEVYEAAEGALEGRDVAEDLDKLRAARAEFQIAIEKLSKAQNAYLSRLNHWLDEINATGVILRDLREGLLDFPAAEGGLEYLLCWKLGETDVNFWHLENDGYSGRKPLTTLSEYY